MNWIASTSGKKKVVPLFPELSFPILREPPTKGSHPQLNKGCDPELQMIYAWNQYSSPLEKKCVGNTMAVVFHPLELCQVTLSYVAPRLLPSGTGFPLMTLVAPLLPLSLTQETLAPYIPTIQTTTPLPLAERIACS